MCSKKSERQCSNEFHVRINNSSLTTSADQTAREKLVERIFRAGVSRPQNPAEFILNPPENHLLSFTKESSDISDIFFMSFEPFFHFNEKAILKAFT